MRRASVPAWAGRRSILGDSRLPAGDIATFARYLGLPREYRGRRRAPRAQGARTPRRHEQNGRSCAKTLQREGAILPGGDGSARLTPRFLAIRDRANFRPCSTATTAPTGARPRGHRSRIHRAMPRLLVSGTHCRARTRARRRTRGVGGDAGATRVVLDIDTGGLWGLARPAKAPSATPPAMKRRVHLEPPAPMRLVVGTEEDPNRRGIADRSSIEQRALPRPARVVLKRGPRGCSVRGTSDTWRRGKCRGFPVEVFNVSAGDASWRASARLAARWAARDCCRYATPAEHGASPRLRARDASAGAAAFSAWRDDTRLRETPTSTTHSTTRRVPRDPASHPRVRYRAQLEALATAQSAPSRESPVQGPRRRGIAHRGRQDTGPARSSTTVRRGPARAPHRRGWVARPSKCGIVPVAFEAGAHLGLACAPGRRSTWRGLVRVPSRRTGGAARRRSRRARAERACAATAREMLPR